MCERVFPHLNSGGIAVAPHGDGHGELLHKDRQGAQLAGEDEVEQRPELLQVVLHGGPRQDEPVGGPELEEGEERRHRHVHDSLCPTVSGRVVSQESIVSER